MGHSYSEEEEKRVSDTFTRLTVPAQVDTPLRDMLVAHITLLVEDYNKRTLARLHYVKTGEVISTDLGYLPKYGSCSPSQVERLVKSMEQSLLKLPDFSVLSDQLLLAEYNALLLELRARVLPDPMPA